MQSGGGMGVISPENIDSAEAGREEAEMAPFLTTEYDRPTLFSS